MPGIWDMMSTPIVAQPRTRRQRRRRKRLATQAPSAAEAATVPNEISDATIDASGQTESASADDENEAATQGMDTPPEKPKRAVAVSIGEYGAAAASDVGVAVVGPHGSAAASLVGVVCVGPNGAAATSNAANSSSVVVDRTPSEGKE